MVRLYYILVTLLLLSNCKNDNENMKSSENDTHLKMNNQLVITMKNDTLENGYWLYKDDIIGLKKEGEYKNGFKTGKWNYIIKNEENKIEWKKFNKHNVKFNYPNYLELSNHLELPIVFIGDIPDNDKNTFIAVLKYDLESNNSTIYDYLNQINKTFISHSSKVLKGRKFIKYTFKTIEFYTVNIQIEKNGKVYNIISQIFETNGVLYDFTYKDIESEMSAISQEIFKDMLYSVEINKFDLFNYNNGGIIKDENILFD